MTWPRGKARGLPKLAVLHAVSLTTINAYTTCAKVLWVLCQINVLTSSFEPNSIHALRILIQIV